MSEGDRGAPPGFLSRWSRRKRAAGHVAPVPAPAAPVVAAPEAGPPGAVAPPAFDAASLPPVESLTADSDFTAFLREEVPAALRRAALRRAWSLDPAIRDFTGPADYAWDFNAPDGGMAGFSLDLPDGVERLLAQAVGLEPSPAGGATPGDGGPPPGRGAAAAPPSETPALETALDEPCPPPQPLTAAVVERDPASAALPASSSKAVQGAPIRRRHGGALPS